MTTADPVMIFDTTLRDGEQSPGASITRDEKLRIARALEKLRVDFIEAGFPIASPCDFEAVKAVAEPVKDSAVCSLARALDKDIDRAGEALKGANAGRNHTFIATSPIHMEKKLRMTPDQVVEQAVHAVRRARQYCDDVEFSPEDAGRSEIDVLCRVLEAVIDAGARTLNIPDTVGYAMPHQFGSLIAQLRERIQNADKAIFSVRNRGHTTVCSPEIGPFGSSPRLKVKTPSVRVDRQFQCPLMIRLQSARHGAPMTVVGRELKLGSLPARVWLLSHSGRTGWRARASAVGGQSGDAWSATGSRQAFPEILPTVGSIKRPFFRTTILPLPKPPKRPALRPENRFW